MPQILLNHMTAGAVSAAAPRWSAEDLEAHLEDEGDLEMSVHGFNFDPESSDATVGLGLIPDGTQAWLAIDDPYNTPGEINLTCDELRALRGQISDLIAKMEWQQATYVHASAATSDKTHLQRKGDDASGQSLCGQAPPYWALADKTIPWKQEPVIGNPRSESLCKKCFAKWQKEQEQES